MNWDEYFLNLCNEISKKSHCLSRQIGAILTIDNIIVSTGYNSPPRKVPNCTERYDIDKNLIKELEELNIDYSEQKNICPRKVLNFPSGTGLEYCPAIHAEKNCLLAASRKGSSTLDTTIYLNTTITPCSQCFGAIINAGVKEIVLIKNIPYDKTVEYLIENSTIKIREFEV